MGCDMRHAACGKNIAASLRYRKCEHNAPRLEAVACDALMKMSQRQAHIARGNTMGSSCGMSHAMLR